MTAGQGRVRLRWSRGTYLTAVMPLAEAGELQDELLEDVIAKGDGVGFVDFTGHDGREVSVRARDVVAVECLPELPDRPTLPATGTAWLQQQAAGCRVPLDRGAPR